MKYLGLSWEDWLVLLAYLAGTVLLWSRFSKGRTNSKSFNLAGQKSLMDSRRTFDGCSDRQR